MARIKESPGAAVDHVPARLKRRAMLWRVSLLGLALCLSHFNIFTHCSSPAMDQNVEEVGLEEVSCHIASDSIPHGLCINCTMLISNHVAPAPEIGTVVLHWKDCR